MYNETSRVCGELASRKYFHVSSAVYTSIELQMQMHTHTHSRTHIISECLYHSLSLFLPPSQCKVSIADFAFTSRISNPNTIMLQSCCRSCQIRTILLKISVPVGFVSTFQIYGQRKVELATQLQISVACGTQHISVCAEGFLGIFVLTPKLSADSLRSLCTSSQPRHLWSNEPATDRAKSGDMRECASF